MGLRVNLNGVNSSLKSFLSVFAVGLNVIKSAFSTFVNQKKFELKFNAQSIYLSKYLNQVYDSSLERIYIVNDATLFEQYFYRNSESILLADQLHLYRDSEIIVDAEQVYLDKASGTLGISFQVLVPTALASLVTNPLFLASVNKYKLIDKNFEVITY